MDCFSNNIQLFELRDKVEGSINLWDCELKFINSALSISVSALEYDHFEDAESLFRMLYQINSPYVTKPHGLRKFGHNQEKGIVIVEKICPFSVWLNNDKKPDMWKIFGDNRTCLGVGYDFKKKFQQIMWGLESIHKSLYRHGSLLDGVYIGADNNIQLSNFHFLNVDSESLKEDFKAFLSLVEEAIRKHPPPTGVTAQLVEVDQLKALFKHFFSRNPFQYTDASWLYLPPILWDSCQKRAFSYKLSSCFKNNFRYAQNSPFSYKLSSCFKNNFRYAQNSFKLQFKNWDREIKPNSPLHDVLTHLVPDKALPGRMKMNDWYTVPSGIVVFVRNYCSHSYILDDPFDEIELIFPGITGFIYNELSMGSYFSGNLICSKPRNYQTLQVETLDRFGVIQQSILPTFKNILDYLNEEVSIWRN